MKKKAFTSIKLCIISIHLIGCASQQSEIEAKQHGDMNKEPWVERNKVFYVGEINDEKNRAIEELLQDNTIEIMFIESPGGDVSAGIDLGLLVYENSLGVAVGAVCASSCANYVLTAGKFVSLERNSRLLWHGGMFQPGITDEFLPLQEKEAGFFNRINVSRHITTCGFDQIDWFHELLHFVGINEIKGFDYKLSDLNRFGVKDIFLVDGTWGYEKNINENGVYRVNYCDE